MQSGSRGGNLNFDTTNAKVPENANEQRSKAFKKKARRQSPLANRSRHAANNQTWDEEMLDPKCRTDLLKFDVIGFGRGDPSKLKHRRKTASQEKRIRSQ